MVGDGKQFQTENISASIRQDVLLSAGSEDHYAPIEQWYQQIRILKNAQSVTGRIFTRSESAQNHCQVGNDGALRTIVAWLDAMLLEDAERRQSPPEVEVSSIVSVPGF